MDRIFNDHFDEYSEPECIELTHIVEQGGQETHKLANFGLIRLLFELAFYLIIGQTEILDVELLQ